MDQEEAQRIAQAIRKAPAEWIQMQGVKFNAQTGTYELMCSYREERRELLSPESWKPIWIKNPRQWIQLLIQHRDNSERP